MIEIAGLLLSTVLLYDRYPFGLDDTTSDVYFEELNEIKVNSLIDAMLKENILEAEPEGILRFSSWGQRLAEIITYPQIWLSIHNNLLHQTRYICIEGVDYVSIEICGRNAKVLFIPTIELLIGAYASMLTVNKNVKDDTKSPIETGYGKTGSVEYISVRMITASREESIEITAHERMCTVSEAGRNEQEYDEEKCVNHITELILAEMQDYT